MKHEIITEGIEMYHGDCLEVMPLLIAQFYDTILTDSPYGIGYQSQWRADKADWKPKIANDEVPFTAWIPLARRLLKDSGAIYSFYRWDVQNEFYDELVKDFDVKSQIVWDKIIHGMGDLKGEYGPQHENILFATMPEFRFVGKRPRTIVAQKRVAANEMVHPNQKPVALMEKLIEDSTPVGGAVLDPFAGSGATGVACARTKRRFTGIEIDEKYFEISVRSISEALMMPKLF